MLFFSLIISYTLAVSLAVGFSKKTYSCVDGTCQLNSKGATGLAQGVCLTTCGAGNFWPYPSGSVSVSSNYEHVNSRNIRIFGGTSLLDGEIEQNFRASIDALGKPLSHNGANLNIKYVVRDKTVTSPSLVNDESYEIDVKTENGEVSVTIQGQTIFGVRHGFETLSQLISFDYIADVLAIPTTVVISDKPNFPYRGVMVDVSRNFMSINKLKETVRAMGFNKLNVLHLHISDTASFPLEVSSQPNVTSYGAYDAAHFYSASEVSDFVRFAHSYGVMILPEIDMPAHVSAGWQWGAEAGLGEFTVCADPDGTHSSQFLTDSLEPPSGQLNVVNENVYPVLNDIYKTAVSLFQSNYFHLGGDEVIVGSDEAWAACYNSSTLAQPILEYLAQHGLSRDDERTFYDLWNNFTMRATGMVQDIYKARAGLDPSQSLTKIHVWGGSGADEAGVTYNMMLEPNLTSILPPELFTVQVWDSSDDSIVKTLLDKGYDVILSNQDYVYLDCGNAGFTNAGGYWCQPYHEWYHIYDYIRDITERWSLTEAEVARIQGSETLIWAEMVDDTNLSQKLWPRSAAIAEALWSNNYLSENEAAAHDARVEKMLVSGNKKTKQAASALAGSAKKIHKDGKVERTWFEAAGRMLQWRETLVQRGVAAEALMPRWCSQRDPYACYVDAGIPQ